MQMTADADAGAAAAQEDDDDQEPYGWLSKLGSLFGSLI